MGLKTNKLLTSTNMPRKPTHFRNYREQLSLLTLELPIGVTVQCEPNQPVDAIIRLCKNHLTFGRTNFKAHYIKIYPEQVK